MMNKKEYLNKTIEHIDIKKLDVVGMIDSMEKMAFQARNLSRGAKIFEMMQKDTECVNFLTLAGSLISAGLKQVVVDMIENNMIDAIVSTGANIVDQDFFEALGFKHYIGTPFVNDANLRELSIDRIYDTYIDEDELRICDETIGDIANSLEKRPYSSREFIIEMGKFLDNNEKYAVSRENSIIYKCYKKGVPIFVPAFSDCSAGFGLVHHQWNTKGAKVSIDSAKDFLEITKIKIKNNTTGIFMIGGGVPKNFVQDIVVAAEVLEFDAPMHKYAIQITVADERDGALSGSTLKEASSWGKVDTTYEQMIYSEATIAMPILVAYSYQKDAHKSRKPKNLNSILLD
ncbi:MAG: deoxyhypusine synthase [Bacteroidota bacterium]|nr:deoxyhypusine synthase [Bacteroidota bacterium]